MRVQLAGYSLARVDAIAIHHTQRNTLKNLWHLAWHTCSLLRLWNLREYHQYIAIHKKNDQTHDMLVFALSAFLMYIGLCLALIVFGK